MGSYTADGKNVMLDALGAVAVFAALFNGDPSDAGTELSGGTPAYARKAQGWGSAAAGSMEDDGDIAFDCPAGSTVNYVAWYTADTGGTLLAYDAVTEETFGSQGTYTLTQSLLDLNG